MRRSPLSLAIGVAILPGVQLASTRVGPISPYQTALNQEIYYRMLGQQIWRGRSPGKTRSLEKSVLLPYRYQHNPRKMHA